MRDITVKQVKEVIKGYKRKHTGTLLTLLARAEADLLTNGICESVKAESEIKRIAILSILAHRK